MRAEKKHTPLSPKAIEQVSSLQNQYGWFRRLRRRREYRTRWFELYLANARDYRRSLKLQAALAKLQLADVVGTPVVDSAIGGEWRPFRVERTLTASMRGEIDGTHFTGNVTANLLDSSSVVLLQNEAGETMRTLIPSPARAAEMLAQAIATWRFKAGFQNSYFWSNQRDTHVSKVVHEFALAQQWTNGLVHPYMIDAIDASCQKPQDQRPVIRIMGALLQKGVALVSAVEVDGERLTFVPTGFFAAITETVKWAVPGAEAPKLIAA